MALTQWADALAHTPYFKYGVREWNNWKNNRPLGDLASLDGVFWHHDASSPGPSPGDVDWLITSYNAKQPSAQIIISYDGTWNFVGSGRAYHAGVVRGPLDWSNTVGIETDHTSNEVMSPRLKDSIETGLAVICVLEGRDADFMTFHKIEARPLTRKQDPYFSGDPLDTSQWEGELRTERAIIQTHINNIRKGIQPEVDDMPYTAEQLTEIAKNGVERSQQGGREFDLRLAKLESSLARIEAVLTLIPERVWDELIDSRAFKDATPISARDMLSYTNADAYAIRNGNVPKD